jgi:hypothetical protein
LDKPIIQKWLQEKTTRITSFKEVQSVLNNRSKAFLEGLKEEEEARKAEAEE